MLIVSGLLLSLLIDAHSVITWIKKSKCGGTQDLKKCLLVKFINEVKSSFRKLNKRMGGLT